MGALTGVCGARKDVGILRLLDTVLYTFNKYECNGGG